MRVRRLLPLAAMIVLAGCQPSAPPNPTPPPPAQRPLDPVVIAKLEELVAVRQELAKAQEMIAGARLGEDYGAAELALIEARLELARERGQRDQVLAELRNIITVRQKLVKIFEARAVDRQNRTEMDQQRAKLLEAEIRLHREQAAAPRP